MVRTPKLFLLLLSFLLLQIPASSQAQAELKLSCFSAPRLIKAFLAHHFQNNKLDDEVKKISVENYVKRIDPSKLLFYKNEIPDLNQKISKVFEDMNGGNCLTLALTHKKVLERTREVEEQIRKVVSDKKYKVDPKVEIITDAEKRQFPSNKEERNQEIAKYAHFQMFNYLEAGTKMKDAKKQLIHRYELLTKRVYEQQMEDILSDFVDSFASALDPHSRYLSADTLEDFKISMKLSLEGIGVKLTSRNGYTIVEEIIPGGATDKTKVLEPKDKIIAVAQKKNKDPVNIIDMDLRNVVKLIRGKKGTPVFLTILRGDGDKTKRLTVSIERDRISLEEQAAKLEYEVIEDPATKKKRNLAVITLPSFYGDQDPNRRSAYTDMKKLLDKVAKKNPDGLLLDLSRNSGGLLTDSVRISGLFLKKGGIVATRMTQSDDPQYLEDTDDAINYAGPMVVLVSRLSASASEILAAALKDYKRAVIVGDQHTFGKGTVQTLVSLPQGLGALKITTGMFFRPGGKSTQRIGVNSDIVVPSLWDVDDLGEKSYENSLKPQTIDPFLSQEANSTPAQWKPVDEDLMEALRKSSTQRMAQSKEFKEITEKLKEQEKEKEKRGIIKLADLKKESKKAKTETASAEKKKKKAAEEKSPQYKEALQILADYVGIRSSAQIN